MDGLCRMSRRCQYACTERIQNHRNTTVLCIFCRSYNIRYREAIAADQIDEQRIAVVTTTERARDQVVAELYERPMYGFRREGKSVEIVQV